MGKTVSSAVIIYLVLFMFGLPLIVTDGFFNITETKSVYFYIISTAIVVAAAFFVKKKEEITTPPGTPLLERMELSLTDKALIVFCVFVFLSALFSKNNDVWLGVASRYQGFLTILLYVTVYFIVSRNFTAAQSFLLFSVLAFAIVCIFGVLNCFDIDPLGVYDGINKSYKGVKE